MSRPWRPEEAPYQVGMLDALQEPNVHTVVLEMAAQLGKTTALSVACGYYMGHRPSPILIVLPTVDDARDYAEEQLGPMIAETPELAAIMAPDRSRSKSNTKTRKRYRGGYLALTGSNAPSGLARRSIRFALADEVDRWAESAGTEGDQLEMLRQRLANVWDGKLVMTSTPGEKGLSKIEHEFLQSDQRRYFVPCPGCNAMQTLVWRDEAGRYRLVWERDSRGAAIQGSERYLCAACDREIEERWKMAMLAAGEWRPTALGKPGVIGFHLNQLYSPWRRWVAIREQWERAQGRPSKLRVFVNTVLGETFEEDAVASPELSGRLEQYPAEVPPGVGVLVASVDTQDSWLEAKVVGYGDGEESWLVAHQQFVGDPGQQAVWLELDEWLQQRFATVHGAAVGVSAVAIDAGGHHAEAVYKFCKARLHRKIVPIRGGSGGRDFLGKPSRNNRYRVPLYTLNVDAGKDMVFSRMRVQKPGPEYMHLPDWVGEEYLEQLAKSEKPVQRYVKGKGARRIYVKLRERNEALDLEVYALAALYMLGDHVRRGLGRKADELARERHPAGRVDAGGVDDQARPGVEAARSRILPRPGRRRNWVTGFRD